MEVSSLVRDEVRERFAPSDAADVEQLLGATELPFLDAPGRSRERDRVHLAVLFEAKGNVERFARALFLAEHDWRDLLVAAGLANDDWPELLRAAGFRVP